MSREVMQQALDALEKFGRGELSEIPVTLLVHNLRAELAKPEGWLPIDSAPKDGTAILSARIVDAGVVFQQRSSWRSVTFPALDNGAHGLEPSFTSTGWMNESSNKRTPEPTHWMPLPHPPSPAEIIDTRRPVLLADGSYVMRDDSTGKEWSTDGSPIAP
jgi:hypothetical protein